MTLGDPWCRIHGSALCTCTEHLTTECIERPFKVTDSQTFKAAASPLTDFGQMTAMLTRAGIKYTEHPVPKKRKDEDPDAMNFVELRNPRAITALRIPVVGKGPGYARFFTILTFSAVGELVGHEAWE